MINYGEKFRFEENKVLEFPDFKLVYLGTKKVEAPKELHISPDIKEFKIISEDDEKTVTWGSGTGALMPCRIQIEKFGLTFLFNPWEEEPVMIGTTAKINSNTVNLTRIGDISKLTQEEVNKLSDLEYSLYTSTSKNAGYTYRFNGKIKHFNPQADPIIYGTTTKSLINTGSEWVISQGGGLLPEYELRPVMLGKEDFSKKMLELGVSEEKLDEFFNYKPDFTNF